MNIVVLLNGSTEVRVRSSEGVTVLPCGCAHTDVMWLQMCRACYIADQVYVEASRSGKEVQAQAAA